SADLWDVSPNSSAVTSLHRAGLDPWVIDFGSPDEVEGGLDRTLTDHVVALSQAIDQVVEHTGRGVPLGGYSQGRPFCSQAAASRRSRHVACVIPFGRPAAVLGATPPNLPEHLLVRGAAFPADHVFSRLAPPGWAARLGFKLLAPVKSTRA